MTATSLNGKGSRWTVMGEHFKQVDLSTKKMHLVSQQSNVYNIHFYANKITQIYLLDLLFVVFFLMRHTNQEALCFH